MDRITRRAVEERVVTITEVDMPTLMVSALDQYGSTLQVSMHLSDGGVTTVPAVGEIWTVKRSGNEWFLEKKSDDGTETTTLNQLEAGDKRIEAKGDIYLNGTTVNLNGTTVNVNGVPPIGAVDLVNQNTTYTVTGANTDLSAPVSFSNFWNINSAGGTIRSIAAPTRGVGSRLSIRNGTANPLTFKHTLAGGTGQQLYMVGQADLVIYFNQSVEFVYDGTYWNELNRDIAITTTSAITSGPPSNPHTGDVWRATGTGAFNQVWSFQYNAGSTSPYKWEFIGGPSVDAFSTAAQTLSGGGVWQPLTSMSLTMPRAGDYTFEGWTYFTGASTNNVYHSISASVNSTGAPVFTMTQTFMVPTGVPSELRFDWPNVTLAAGDVVRMLYWNNAPVNDAVSNVRNLKVIPIRVS